MEITPRLNLYTLWNCLLIDTTFREWITPKHHWHSFIIDFILREKRTYTHTYISISIYLYSYVLYFAKSLGYFTQKQVKHYCIVCSYHYYYCMSAFDIHLLLFSPLHNNSDARVVLSFKCKRSRQHHPLLVDHAQ